MREQLRWAVAGVMTWVVLALLAPLPVAAQNFHRGEILSFTPDNYLLNGTTTGLLRVRNTGVAGYLAAEVVSAPSGWTVTPRKTEPRILANNATFNFPFQITTPEFYPTVDVPITFRLYVYEADILENQADQKTFQIRTMPAPGAFNLLTPPNRATGYDLPITFDWEDSLAATSYRVEFYADNAGFPLQPPFYTANNVPNSSFTLDSSIVIDGQNLRLPPSQPIHWRVTALNPVGSRVNTGGAFSFVVRDRPPLGLFDFVVPATANEVMPVQPSFQWTASENVVLYLFELYREENGLPADPPLIREGVGTATRFDWGARPPLAPGNYFVHVSAFNESWGRPIRFGPRPFTTTNLTAFVLQAPAASATGLSNAPFFQWQRSSGALEYLLEVVLEAGDVYVPVLSRRIGGGAASFQWTDAPLSRGARYWWQVTAIRNEERRLNHDGPRWFEVSPLGAFSALVPASGETNVARRPTFEWHAAAGASSHVVEVAPSDDGVPDLANLRTSGTLAGTTARWTATFAELDPGKEYFWRVRARQAAVSVETINREGWQSFRTTPLAAFALREPADGTLEVGRTPTFRWDPIAGALRYRVRVSAQGLGELPPVETTMNVGSLAWPAAAALTGNRDYWWTVDAIGADGEQRAAQTWTFRTGNHAHAVRADLIDALVGRKILGPGERQTLGLAPDEVLSVSTLVPFSN
jgi:hypothetical protein